MIYGSSKCFFMHKNMDSRSETFVFNSVLNFRRMTHFWLCLLETQVHHQCVSPSAQLYLIFLNLSTNTKGLKFKI